MAVLDIKTARVFLPLLKPSRYKGAYGGRGSGKSHFFAELGVERCMLRNRSRGVCLREVQKDLKDSAKQLIEDKINSLGLAGAFDMQRDEIRTPGGGVIIFRGMKDYNADSIKSLEQFDWAWIEEAHTLSKRSLELLRPTIRAEGSEIWASWNPRSAKDPVDEFFRGQNPPPDSICVKANYNDNPFFPPELEQERLFDIKANRDRYGHIWLGEYEPMAVGAIWDRATIHECRRELPTLGKIAVGVDPAVSNEDGSDEHGIIVAGLGEDERGYVLDDVSCHGTPRQWATRAIAAYDKWEADEIVIEVNQGGDMVRHTLESVRPGLPIVEVRASRGKHVRAEPISSLYSLGRVSHVGAFPELEDQMCQMTAGGYAGEGSPDRVDALVWVLSRLFPDLVVMKTQKPPQEENYGGGRGKRSWMGA